MQCLMLMLSQYCFSNINLKNVVVDGSFCSAEKQKTAHTFCQRRQGGISCRHVQVWFLICTRNQFYYVTFAYEVLLSAAVGSVHSARQFSSRLVFQSPFRGPIDYLEQVTWSRAIWPTRGTEVKRCLSLEQLITQTYSCPCQ